MQRMTFVYLGTYICCKEPVVSCIHYQEHVSPPPLPTSERGTRDILHAESRRCVPNRALTIVTRGLPPSTKTSCRPRSSPLFLSFFFQPD